MQYSDQRATGVFAVGAIVVTSVQQYLVIRHQADDAILGSFSLLNVGSSETVATAADLAALKSNFITQIAPVTIVEVIPAVDVTLNVVSPA